MSEMFNSLSPCWSIFSSWEFLAFTSLYFICRVEKREQKSFCFKGILTISTTDRQADRQMREHGLCCSCGLTLFFKDEIWKEDLHFNNRILCGDLKIKWTCSKKHERAAHPKLPSQRGRNIHIPVYLATITIDECLGVSAQSLVYSVWNIQVESWDQLFKNYLGSISTCWCVFALLIPATVGGYYTRQESKLRTWF